MKRIFLPLVLCLMSILPSHAGNASDSILTLARRVNDRFMAVYADPTRPTFVKKQRPSSLWTRAVYYEGLMALYTIDPLQQYLDYTDRWANFHKWTPRNGITTTDADDQCCAQTYLQRYAMVKDSKMIKEVKANLDHQMASGRYDYWTWIDAIQMAMPVYVRYYQPRASAPVSTTPSVATCGAATHVVAASSTRRTGCGGATRTTCHPIRKKTATTATGVVATAGYTPPC